MPSSLIVRRRRVVACMSAMIAVSVISMTSRDGGKTAGLERVTDVVEELVVSKLPRGHVHGELSGDPSFVQVTAARRPRKAPTDRRPR